MKTQRQLAMRCATSGLKSHAVKLLTELFDVAGYKKGMDYEFVAFQATNAADLDGRTMHNAMGLNSRDFNKATRRPMQEIAQGFHAFRPRGCLGIEQAELYFEPVRDQLDHVKLLGVDSASRAI